MFLARLTMSYWMLSILGPTSIPVASVFALGAVAGVGAPGLSFPRFTRPILEACRAETIQHSRLNPTTGRL
jgi:hypothetical protein